MFNQACGTIDSPNDESIRGAVTLTWRDLSVFVKVRNKNFFGKSGEPYKKIIDNVTGAVKGGSLVILMGPSGAGKSTLMGALAHRNPNDVFMEGDVRINGEPADRKMNQISGFMHQEDLFIGTLTVREHLLFMARLKLGGVKTERDINRIVNRFIIEMGLNSCADRRIGTIGQGKVISGGERKRLAFATEVLTDPQILFCDEPTTGLDSFSASCLVSLMKQMTSRGKTVLCTIHQPSSELFAMFHQLILLSEGRIAFMGNTESALEFFQKHGYPCPANYNPAEIIIRALSVTADPRSKASVRKICNEFSATEFANEIDELINNMMEEEVFTRERTRLTSLKKRAKGPSWFAKVYYLTYRSFLQVVRDPSVQTVRILQKLGIALMSSLCFLGTIGLTQAGVQSVQGAIFVMVTENTFPPMYGVLSLFPDEFPLFLREHRGHLYSTHVYYLSKMISLLPGLIVEPVLFVIVAYLIAGLKHTYYAFLMSILIAILTTNVAAACGCFFSNAFGSVSMALAFLVPIDYTLMVTSGLFIKLSSMSVLISWFRYFSWFMYSNEALTIVQWEDVTNISCEYTNRDIPCLNTGEEVLAKFDFSASHLLINLGAMGIMYIVFHIFSYLCLWWKTKRTS